MVKMGLAELFKEESEWDWRWCLRYLITLTKSEAEAFSKGMSEAEYKVYKELMDLLNRASDVLEGT